MGSLVAAAAIASTATAFTAAAVSATTTTAAAALKRASTAAATAALFTRACDIDREGAPLKSLAMELLDCVLRFVFRAHRDECKSTAFAREFVLHQQHIADGSCLAKEVLQIGFRYVKGKIPNVKFVI